MISIACAALTVPLTTTAVAAPRQHIRSPWNRWIAIQQPALVTVHLGNGKINATQATSSVPTGTSQYVSQWRYSSNRKWLIADVKAKYSCKGTQKHKKVGLSTNWDSHSAKTGKKHITRTFKDVKLAKAADLQKICDVKGTWSSFRKTGSHVVQKKFGAVYDVLLSATCKASLAPTRHPKTKEKYTVYAVCESVTYDHFSLHELQLLWKSSVKDNLTTNKKSKSGYKHVRSEGWVFKAKKPGTVPLKLFYSPSRKDYFTAATAQGIAAANKAGYQNKGIIGYVYSAKKKGTKPLKLFWSSARKDNITVSSKAGQQDAHSAGYKFVRNEGYVIY